MSDTKERAKWKWKSILSNFIDSKLLDGKHRPCPICGGKNRFRFDDTEGVGNYICSHCGAGTGIHLLAQSQSISHSESWKLVETVIGESVEEKPKPEADRSARINRVLAACGKITKGGDVHRYLYSRGLTPDYSKLRLAEANSTSGETMIVGRFQLGKKMTGLHVTFLKDGKKITGEDVSPRKMFAMEKDGLVGSAIRLHPLDGGYRLVVAEGIETALAASQMLGIPAWATGSAGLLEQLQIPDEVTEIVIAGDKDKSFTGQAAAYALAKRLVNQKNPKVVHVIFPKVMGTDFNDALMEQIKLDKQGEIS